MAHGTLINGTAYGITGGKCLVGGTAYDIKKGRTLVGGTGYDVEFVRKTIIKVKKVASGFGTAYITVNGGNRIYSTQTLEFEAGEPVELFAYAFGLNVSYPGIITLDGKVVGSVAGSTRTYEFDCTGMTVSVEIREYDMNYSFNDTIDITTE